MRETSAGPLWIPAGTAPTTEYMIMERIMDIYASPHSVVLDCGANIGLFARSALQKGASVVIAIDPMPIHIDCLRRNFASEISDGHVVLYPKGVWDKDDFLTLTVDATATSSSSFVLDREGPKIDRLPVTTIDGVVAELGLERVDFIKMDIEGAERNALAGASVTLGQFQPRMAVCVYHLPDDPTVIPEVIAAANPSYNHETCKCCKELDDWTIRPEVLHFF